jgi:hypothetical protein
MLVAPDDVAALAAALDVMMSAPPPSESCAAQARHAVAEFDIALVGQRWIDLLSLVQG